MSVPPENHQNRAGVATGQQPSLQMSVHRDIRPMPSAPMEEEPIRVPKPGKRRPKPEQGAVNRRALQLCENARDERKPMKIDALETLLRDDLAARRNQTEIAYALVPAHLKLRRGGQPKDQI
jgi:hypothetical protein